MLTLFSFQLSRNPFLSEYMNILHIPLKHLVLLTADEDGDQDVSVRKMRTCPCNKIIRNEVRRKYGLMHINEAPRNF